MAFGGNITQRIDIIDIYDPRVVGRAAAKGTLFRYIPPVGLPELLIKDDDGFSTNWTSVGGGAIPVTVPVVELRVITNAEAFAKQIFLSSVPSVPAGVILNIRNSPSTFYGDDFIVSGQILSWSGLALDGLISAGDKFTISYWV